LNDRKTPASSLPRRPCIDRALPQLCCAFLLADLGPDVIKIEKPHLARQHSLDARAVRKVRASIRLTHAAMLRNHEPHTGLEAKFSLEFAIAAALSVRKVGLSELQDRFVLRDDVRALMQGGDRLPARTDAHRQRRCGRADGRLFDSGEIEEARGRIAHPLIARELEAKFMDCVAGNGHDTARLYGQL
jgi:aconitate decarboxylase